MLKSVNDYPILLEFIPDWNKTLDDAYPSSLKYVPDWSATPKMLVIVDNAGLDKHLININNTMHIKKIKNIIKCAK